MPRAPVDLDTSERCAAARERLEQRAGLTGAPVAHFRRPVERPFTALERGKVTVLFGGLTATHERLIQPVLESCGHPARALPEADLTACMLGRQYCDNGVCNPAYFTIGALIRYLQQLEAAGMSRSEIIEKYVFFTAGSCGPCRFGMYESQYRIALRNAGFDGFRVLLFQQDHGIRADTGEPGMKLSLHFGIGALDAFNFADALQGFGYATRPYEVVAGLTNRRIDEALDRIAAAIMHRPQLSAPERVPPALWAVLRRRAGLRFTANILMVLHELRRGSVAREALAAFHDALDAIEVDRLRVKPVVKVTGEFWAQTTEGDGNFRMFSFLENEGAHVLVEPLGGWVMYLVQYARAQLMKRRGLAVRADQPPLRRLRARGSDDWRIAKKWMLLEFTERIYRARSERLRHALGDVAHPLVDQRQLARLAAPYYSQLARGGEGHLEVAKNIYYTTRNAAHMVLSLKPFGCMPSTQSDGVQSAVVAHFKDMLYVPVETAPDGELAAHSRVQMALVDAGARAQEEFERVLASTGRRLDDIRSYVAEHPELRRVGYHVPHQHGVAGVAANFVLHVDRLMKQRRRLRRLAALVREERLP